MEIKSNDNESKPTGDDENNNFKNKNNVKIAVFYNIASLGIPFDD